MYQSFLKWLSKYVPVKVPAGKSFTVDDTPAEPETVEPKIIPLASGETLFCRFRHPYHAYEVCGVDSQTGLLVLRCLQTDETLQIDTKTFDILFKAVKVNVKFPPLPKQPKSPSA